MFSDKLIGGMFECFVKVKELYRTPPVWLNTENNLFSRKQLFFGESKLF